MKVAYVNGVCVHHDAISNSIEEIRTLQAMGYEVKLYAYACDHAGSISSVSAMWPTLQVPSIFLRANWSCSTSGSITRSSTSFR